MPGTPSSLPARRSRARSGRTRRLKTLDGPPTRCAIYRLRDERDGPAGLRGADRTFRLSRTENQWPGHAADVVPWFHNRGYRRTIYLAVPATTRIPWGAPNGTALYDLRNRARLCDGRQLLGGGAKRAGSVRFERPRCSIAVPARRSGCRRFRPRGSLVPGIFHGIALAAQQRELQCRQSLQHVAYADRFWHLWWSAYHQPAGGSFRVRVKSAMVPEVLVHRALRPEAYGGLVHYTKTAAASYPLHSDVLNSQALAGILEKNNGTYFLPIAFPEGSPTHPSYGSGHATVAGACVTVWKAFFNTDNVAFPNPMVSGPAGLSPTACTGGAAGQVTLAGEVQIRAH